MGTAGYPDGRPFYMQQIDLAASVYGRLDPNSFNVARAAVDRRVSLPYQPVVAIGYSTTA